MSKVADVLIGFEKAFKDSKEGYDFWIGEIEEHGYDEDCAIAAAVMFGQMVGIALAEESVFSPSPLMECVRDMKPRLYKEDYE